jgi:hypothetical protein
MNHTTPDSSRSLRFPVWCLLLVLGFGYVAVILCHRTNPFFSRYDRTTDLLVLLALAPILYYLGPRQTLKTTPPWSPLYVLPFLIALHFKYLGDGLGVHFSLRPQDLESLDARARIALVAAIFLVLVLAAYHLHLARKAGILLPYSLAFLAGPLVVLIITLALNTTHYLHVHHYLWAGYLVPFCRFDRRLSVIAQAVFLGICVEGASRWGLDPVWYARG